MLEENASPSGSIIELKDNLWKVFTNNSIFEGGSIVSSGGPVLLGIKWTGKINLANMIVEADEVDWKKPSTLMK